MSASDSRLLAGIKLAELERQRQRLNQHYDDVERRAGGAADAAGRLRVLYEGLREARFAGKPLHPDVANLDVLLYEADRGPGSAEMIERYVRQLRKEMDRGRLRGEFARVFGRLLEEWAESRANAAAARRRGAEGAAAPQPAETDAGPDAAEGGGDARQAEQAEQAEQAKHAGHAAARAQILDLLTAEAGPPVDPGFLAGLFESAGGVFDQVRREVAAFGEDGAMEPVTVGEVAGLLSAVSRDVHLSAGLRDRASAARGSAVVVNEYAGALTVLLNNLESWDWPGGGVPLRVLWARTKWRPYYEPDLLSLLLVQLTGARWGIRLKALFRSHVAPAVAYYDSPEEPGLFSPDARAAGWPGLSEKSALRDPAGRGYEGALRDAGVTHARANALANLFLPTIPDNIESLGPPPGGYGGGGGYGNRRGGDGVSRDGGGGALEALLSLVNAEIELHEAARADWGPLWVVQTDLRDYYLRIPHELADALLEQLGVPRRWRDFFARCLRPAIRTADGLRPVRRGVPLNTFLGDMLADWLLLMMDLHVYRSAGVRPARVIDDVWMLAESREQAARAWQAVREFCQACGLEPNEAKSGSVRVGSEARWGRLQSSPAAAGGELPEGPPRWALLRLNQRGEWNIDPESFDAVRRQTRERVEAAGTVLEMVAQYNAQLAYLMRNLGLGARLGSNHLDAAGGRLAGLHHSLLGDGRGVVAAIRERLTRRFPDARIGAARSTAGTDADASGLPEPLMYWPITAGGLGLTHPLVTPAALRKSLLADPAPRFPPAPKPAASGSGHWSSSEIESWARPYRWLLANLAMAEPDPTPRMAVLLDDFVARSGEVGGRRRRGPRESRGSRPPSGGENLSPYWKWIVHTYGPALLEELGTFRFLLTELVPLQLILEARIQAASLPGGADGGAPTKADHGDGSGGGGDAMGGDVSF